MPDWCLEICGDGQLRPRLEALATELGLMDRIEFRGLVSRDEVYRRMGRCEILVTPSLKEGFCNANAEAMAAGMALATSRIGPLPEIAGDAAAYFDPSDLEDVTRVLVRLMSNERLRAELSGRGHKQVECLTLESAARGYRQVYRTIR